MSGPAINWLRRGGTTIVAVVGVMALGGLLATGTTRSLVIGVIFALLFGVLLLTRPTALLLVYLATRPLIDAAVEVPFAGWSLGTVWGGGLLVVLGAYWFVDGARRPFRKSWFIPLAFLIAYVLAAFARPNMPGEDIQYAISISMKLSSWVLAVLACEQIASNARGQRLLHWSGTMMAVFGVGVIGWAISQNQYGAAYYTWGTYASLGQGPHGLASLATLGSAFVWIGAMRSKRPGFWMVLAALLGIAVAMSLVRTMIIAFAVITLWFLLWSIRKGNVGAIISASAAVAAAAATFYAFRDVALTRMADLSSITGSGGAQQWAGSGRVAIWGAVTHAVTSSASVFLLGSGARGSFKAVTKAIGAAIYSHNDYLEFLITGGIGLLGLFVATLGWFFVSATGLATDPQQSEIAQETGRVIRIVVLGYAIMALLNGVAFYASSLTMAMIIGLARGMRSTPGHTFMDVPTREGEGS